MPHAAQGDFSIPPTPGSIGPAWLTRELRRSGAIRRAKVVSVRVDPVAAGSGFVGQAARLHVEYDRPEPGAPARMFVKLSSADPEVRRKLHTVGLYETEVGFYRDVAAREKLPIRVPRPYVSLYDPATDASILAIEDIGHARFGDQVAGCSPEDAQAIVRQLALMHAHFWDAPRLKTLKWLRSLGDNAESSTALYRAMLPQFEKRWANLVTPGFLATARRFADLQTEYYRHCSPGPHTLVHGDFRPDNLAFTGDGEERDFLVFDWQTAQRARGARDLAYFVSGSMITAQRRQMEKELLQLYHETLSSHGVKRYSRDDLARDFRCGLGRGLSVLVVAGGVLDFSSDRGAELVRESCERTASALEDHDFLGQLENIAACAQPSANAPVRKHKAHSRRHES